MIELLDRIARREAKISIVGLGYVGLPLAVAFAEAGFHVTGIDTDHERVRAINRGVSYISDVSGEKLSHLVARPSTSRLGRQEAPASIGMANSGEPPLTATTSYDAVSHSDAVILCLPTPLSKTKEPDMSFIMAAIEEVAQCLHPGMLLVLESTTYPGTTEELIMPRLEEEYTRIPSPSQHSDSTGKIFGRELFLAFSPERIDPGRQDWTLQNTPKVIGGVTPACLEVAMSLYQCIVRTMIPVSTTRTAEMVKLLENTFRAVNIALVNEMAIICDRLDIDVWEVIDAAKSKPFGFMPFYPGPGLGGHCIPLDPQYLAWKLRQLNYNARFIHLADEINFGMPNYVMGKITDALNSIGKPVKDSKILVLGVTYKANVADIRESPALDLIELLWDKGAGVSYHDPYITTLPVGERKLRSVDINEEALRSTDCAVIMTDHISYDWPWIVNGCSLLVDTRNATAGIKSESCEIIKL
ncbi:MAG: nucleotide sugar dehydrogenase [Chloroflexi bacterium]|nr:nucleotide sugar dehydrogenase [Chloroflexota bacterium]